MRFLFFSVPGFALARPASKRHSEFQFVPPTEAGGDSRRLRVNMLKEVVRKNWTVFSVFLSVLSGRVSCQIEQPIQGLG